MSDSLEQPNPNRLVPSNATDSVSQPAAQEACDTMRQEHAAQLAAVERERDIARASIADITNCWKEEIRDRAELEKRLRECLMYIYGLGMRGVGWETHRQSILSQDWAVALLKDREVGGC